MEAIIVEIMESWPLQLAVDADNRSFHIQLSETVTILEKGRPVDTGALSPGDRIRVDFEPRQDSNNTLPNVVSTIEILN